MNYYKYKKTTKQFMEGVEQYLTNKYGSVSESWEANLMMLADNLDLYKECVSSIRKNGIYDVQTGKKNPLLITVKDLQASITKQIQHLGLSPYAASKIRIAEDDDEDEFIESLTNE